jgi:MazG family protein
MPTEGSNLSALDTLIDTLRGDNGCPWDRKQTPASIARYLVEEVYELVEAIATGGAETIREELGDVLFHLFFIAAVFREKGAFDIEEAARSSVAKMTRRHPHVFGDTRIDGSEAVRDQWQRIKQQENRQSGRHSALGSVPAALPSLTRAYRISERAGRSGFDWAEIAGVVEKVEEEWSEFKAELARAEREKAATDRLALEFGDLLFTLVNVARFAGFHPETALADATRKFERRFRLMEKLIEAQDAALDALPPEERERFWERAKAAIG